MTAKAEIPSQSPKRQEILIATRLNAGQPDGQKGPVGPCEPKGMGEGLERRKRSGSGLGSVECTTEKDRSYRLRGGFDSPSWEPTPGLRTNADRMTPAFRGVTQNADRPT